MRGFIWVSKTQERLPGNVFSCFCFCLCDFMNHLSFPPQKFYSCLDCCDRTMEFLPDTVFVVWVFFSFFFFCLPGRPHLPSLSVGSFGVHCSIQRGAESNNAAVPAGDLPVSKAVTISMMTSAGKLESGGSKFINADTKFEKFKNLQLFKFHRKQICLHFCFHHILKNKKCVYADDVLQ